LVGAGGWYVYLRRCRDGDGDVSIHVAIHISIYLSIHTSYSLLSPILSPFFLSFSPSSTSHDPQLAEPLDDILVHARQPLLLEPRLATGTLHRRLQVLAHKRDEV
jgi:hypothetical protein